MDERASMMQCWVVPGGLLAQQVMSLIHQHPRLLVRLAHASGAPFHAYCAWLQLGPSMGSEAERAAYLYDTRPKILLQEIFPDLTGSKGFSVLWRALGRQVAPQAQTPHFYKALAALAGLPQLERALLNDDLEWNYERLTGLNQLLSMDPLVLQARPAISSGREARLLDTFLVWFRTAGILEDEAATSRSLRGVKTVPQLRDWVYRRLGRLRSPRSFQIPPGSPLIHLQSVDELRRAGLRMQNCLGKNDPYQLQDFLTGRYAFFLWQNESAIAAVKLEMLAPNLATVDEMKGFQNASIGSKTKAIRADLAAIGIQIVESSMGTLLRALELDDDLMEGEFNPGDFVAEGQNEDVPVWRDAA